MTEDSDTVIILAGLKQEMDNYHPDSVEDDCSSCGRTVLITPDTEVKIQEEESKGNNTNIVCGRCFIGVGQAG